MVSLPFLVPIQRLYIKMWAIHADYYDNSLFVYSEACIRALLFDTVSLHSALK